MFPMFALAMASPGDDPSTYYLRGRLRSVSAKYASCLDRIDSATAVLPVAMLLWPAVKVLS